MTKTTDADNWLKQHLKHSTNDLLDNPWILDVDTNVKPIYGKQEGAMVSYNPTKRGRPSRCYHTYLVANQCLVLGVELVAGNEHASKHDIVPLSRILDELSTDKRPHLVRGDSGFGNDPMMRLLEDKGQPYLFNLNQLLWLYRDRADAENVFDELKNHWGWGGFTTQDLGRCQLSAQAVALIYNWWTLYVRMLNSDKHHEAITSKPLLMHGIGRQTKHANQTKITIASTHAKTDKPRHWLIHHE